jgi:hypothetical protein
VTNKKFKKAFYKSSHDPSRVRLYAFDLEPENQMPTGTVNLSRVFSLNFTII